jgi:hypothetical protein
MSLGQFQDELRRVSRFNAIEEPTDPLSTAVKCIRDNPTLAQQRLLSRLVQALTHEHGEFRRAEASAFDSNTLRLAIALMNAARAGTIAAADWQRAVEDLR